jgi:hypothetical protein
LNVERPSNSPPGGLATAAAALLADGEDGELLLVGIGAQADSPPIKMQPVRERCGERSRIFMVKRTAFSLIAGNDRH